MAMKTAGPVSAIYDSVCAMITGFLHRMDLDTACKAFVETLMACAGSCFPALDTYQDLGEEEQSTDEKQKVNIADKQNPTRDDDGRRTGA